MKEIIVAKRYARAMADVIEGKLSIDVVMVGLKDVSDIIEKSAELKNIFYNPTIAMEFKKGILSRILYRLKLTQIVENFLYLILQKNRIRYLNKIIIALEELSDQITNRVKVRVKTAFRLDENEVEMLKKRFVEVTGKDVILDIQIDPDLIGGIVVQIRSTVLDGSIRNQLRAFTIRR